ncbi:MULTISPECIES: roadblock/LC7 domain-containing protein [unclassified Streptomyces]|uniref:roadblock/LC7 domain-containing protein n=1 Tax=unclassified Streptomyces TaxID=2593676 RepID=UPI0015872731|nr:MULTISPECIES: roadblock/LC7 domain-containing protein [unclassified Streptomyces]NUV71493.1 roadblock/LC7 domain-containing protein [Streptomyces sp. CAI-121]NUW04151.1 roadblock/LC7 domain-containing protein [Streptomyces sp. CAI 127]NUW17664.1 roadblock/LC7 domain-containing protein [Streptomyces sp. CAI-68]
MQTTDNSLTWLLQRLLEQTPGTRHALALSRDGLKLCWSEHLTLDQADQLAAICSGMQALAQGASIEFGDGSGGVRHSMTEFHGGLLFIVEAGEGAHLAVVATEEADPSIVGNQMTQMVEQIGEHLRAAPRGTVPASASPGRTSPGRTSPGSTS